MGNYAKLDTATPRNTKPIKVNEIEYNTFARNHETPERQADLA